MAYDPKEHAIAGRQVAAGWIVCLVVVGLALGLTAKREPVSQAALAATRPITTASTPDPLSGAHIPRFIQCRSRLDQSVVPADMDHANPRMS